MHSVGLGLAGAVLAAALGAGGWYWASRPAHLGADTSSYEGMKLGDEAPGFRLVDQNGRSVSLADFRGKVVVLTLLDPDCTDICPIYAHQYRLAYEALGNDAAKVAFLAFNSNDEKTSVADMATASQKWGVDRLPNS